MESPQQLASFDPFPPKYIFGAGEMCDHLVRLLEWTGKPVTDIELFDDAFPERKIGPAGLPIVANFIEGIKLSIHDRHPAMIATGSRGRAVGYSITRRLAESGAPLASAIYPTFIFGPGARAGSHLVAMPGCILGKNTVLGRWTWLYSGVILEHDNFVEDNVILGPGVVTGGFVHIGSHAFLGVGVRVAPGVTIGERSIIGAGAVVVDDIPPGMIAMGVPARVHRPVPEGADAPTLDALRRVGCG